MKKNEVRFIISITSVMRSSFKADLQFITFYAIKKKTNKMLMAYIPVLILGDMNKVLMCCGALKIGETFKAYKCMLESIFKIVSAIKRDDIQYIFSDEFLTTNFLESLELRNVSLFFIIN